MNDFGRGRRKGYTRFLINARGSVQETGGRCGRFEHWLPRSILEARSLQRDYYDPFETTRTLRQRA